MRSIALLLASLPSFAVAAGDGGVSEALSALAGRGNAAQRLALSGTAPISNYVRLRRTRSSLLLQTATVALSLVDEQRDGLPFELGLVSTVHLAEPPYYTALQDKADGVAGEADPYDRVLFELLVDESAVETDSAGARRLRVPLQPATALAGLAAANRLTTQVGALDCMRDERWVLADVSRAELADKERDSSLGATFVDAPSRARLIAPLRNLLGSGPANTPAPLWRGLLFTLPAPEVALLLDDWVASRGAPFAPALRALIVAIGRLDFGAASRISFAQTLASGESTQDGSLAGALVRWRNGRALAEVDRALEDGCGRIAMLYGALHMRDLRAKLQARYRLVDVGEPEWQTAWSIALPRQATDGLADGASGANDDEADEMELTPRELLPPALATLAILAIDGSDWVETVGALAGAIGIAVASLVGADDPALLNGAAAGVAVSGPEAALGVALYLARHALLYLALQRWAFQWDSRWWAVESDL